MDKTLFRKFSSNQIYCTIFTVFFFNDNFMLAYNNSNNMGTNLLGKDNFDILQGTEV